MNKAQLVEWKKSALLHTLSALAQYEEIRNVLIFKGALILNERLGTERMSLDIDSNLNLDFSHRVPDREDQKSFFEEHIPTAVTRYFESHNPVRYEFKNLRVIPNPQPSHPRGWDAFKIKITIEDNENKGVRGLPALPIDVAAPEKLSQRSISEMQWNGSTIWAYTLERIAGEKARAFLSTLPSYREKIQKPGEAVRAKDLYDLSRILQAIPLENKPFWECAGNEFLLACESRYIDCSGLASFQEDWEVTKETFLSDTIIPHGTNFDEVSNSLKCIVELWAEMGITPFEFPLPTDCPP